MRLKPDPFCHAELVSASHVKGCVYARGILKQVQDDKQVQDGMQVQDNKICHADYSFRHPTKKAANMQEGS